MVEFKAVKNPLVSGKGLCDPHLRPHGGRVYLYTGHDAADAGGYVMDKWTVWSSCDMVEWRLEKEINPEQTFMGKSNNCWAADGCFKNGRHYFYFSVGGEKTGVLVSDTPSGEYVDVLKRPLLDGTNVPGKEYDPAIFIDDDQNAYILFGAPSWAYKDDGGYFIAQLNEDMISLKEKPRRIFLNHPGDDKVSLHKYNGRYYLCYASFYAVSDSVYGPYTFRGNVGVSSDHGSYIEWNGQWFKSFTVQDPTDYRRAGGICYVHFKNNGDMACDQIIAEYGVGHYDSDWNKIQAEWYMACSNMEKTENDLGTFSVRPLGEGGTVFYPKVKNLKGKNGISFAVMSLESDAKIELFAGKEKLCECAVKQASFGDYRGYRCVAVETKAFTSDEEDITLVFKNCGKNRVFLDWFKFFKR